MSDHPTQTPSTHELASRALAASTILAGLDTQLKNALLNDLADAIDRDSHAVLDANRSDLRSATERGLSEAKTRRLTLSASSISQLSAGIRQVAALPDPVGTCTQERVVPSGLKVRRVRVPLGVVCMIYEARPGVTVDAFALCFKSGNACLLKGGREAFESNRALSEIVHQTLRRHSLPEASLTLLTSTDRQQMKELLQLDTLIDLVIPRGGEELIRFVAENSRIPTIQHFKGVCHIFVDAGADVERALRVCLTAKASAPATCNAAECFLIHQRIAQSFLPQLVRGARDAGIELRACERSLRIDPTLRHATADDFGREFLDMVAAVRIVDDVHEAITHIRRYGSRHTEAILSNDQGAINDFRRGVDASCVVVNASTRFNDGFQLGLGAEIGISTTKLHAYGPMGLEELTTQRFEVGGDYQTR
mgnify:CR=1 FL=1